MARPAAGGHVCLIRGGVIDRSPVVAAGATWRVVIANAPWAVRRSHTTVIDAAGAIYLIGGYSGGSAFYNDVFVSTDGGAWAGLTLGRYLQGTQQVLNGYSQTSHCSLGVL